MHFFFEKVTTSGKFAISYTVEKMIPLQLVIYHLTFTPKCLDRKFRNRAACQRNHSNERHIRAVYTRENKPRLTLAAAYIRREHPV